MGAATGAAVAATLATAAAAEAITAATGAATGSTEVKEQQLLIIKLFLVIMNLRKQSKLHQRLTTVFTGQPGPDHGYTGPCVDPLIPEPTGKEEEHTNSCQH